MNKGRCDNALFSEINPSRFLLLVSRRLIACLFHELIFSGASRLIIRCADEPNLEIISVFPDSGLCRRVHTCTSDNRCVNALRSPNSVANGVAAFSTYSRLNNPAAISVINYKSHAETGCNMSNTHSRINL